jgi:hypothetical protein
VPARLPAAQVTGEHNEDCKRLLRLMGVPIVDAPSEAEAQCAAMAKEGVVYGAATEDMDCLTFGCPRLIKHLMAPQVCVGGRLGKGGGGQHSWPACALLTLQHISTAALCAVLSRLLLLLPPPPCCCGCVLRLHTPTRSRLARLPSRRSTCLCCCLSWS